MIIEDINILLMVPRLFSLTKCLTVPRVWDEADYVVPPAENGAFFITTNVLITPNQTQVRREIDN